jgi:hypothetical protein
MPAVPENTSASIVASGKARRRLRISGVASSTSPMRRKETTRIRGLAGSAIFAGAMLPAISSCRWVVEGFTAPFYSIVSGLSKTQPQIRRLERRLNSSDPLHGRGMPTIEVPTIEVPTIEVSWGELIDKITILEIKAQRLTAPLAVANVRTELAALNAVFERLAPAPAALHGLKQELKTINGALWDIENRTRAKEAAKTFDAEFIELTRSVYLNNDRRAGIKRRINELLNSGLIEEKHYTPYTA